MVPRQCRALCFALIVEYNDWVVNYLVWDFYGFWLYYIRTTSRYANERFAHIVKIPEIKTRPLSSGKREDIPDPPDTVYRVDLVSIVSFE